jgi:hypothetical protein
MSLIVVLSLKVWYAVCVRNIEASFVPSSWGLDSKILAYGGIIVTSAIQGVYLLVCWCVGVFFCSFNAIKLSTIIV